MVTHSVCQSFSGELILAFRAQLQLLDFFKLGMEKKKNPVIKYRHPRLRARSFEALHLTFEGRYGFGLG